MEYLLVICIVLQIILIVLYLVKLKTDTTKKQKELIENQSIMLNTIQSSLNDIHKKNDFTNTLYSKQSMHIDDSMQYIQDDLRRLLKESTHSSTQINQVYSTVQTFQNIMINKKQRGNFGEYQLNHLLSIYAGESQEIYETQYKLSNNYIADVVLRLPEEERVLVVDSKFPLENYNQLIRDDISEIEKIRYISLFKQNIKKHIDDISKKYITNETLESAIMFIPSEAIYFYICSELSEIIDEAHRKHILITSPTTLLGVVFTLVNITKDMKRTKNIKQLEKDIVNMFDDVHRLKERLNKLDRSLDSLTNASKELHISADKIYNKVIRIHDGYTDEK